MQQLNYLCCTSNLILSGWAFNEAVAIFLLFFSGIYVAFSSLIDFIDASTCALKRGS